MDDVEAYLLMLPYWEENVERYGLGQARLIYKFRRKEAESPNLDKRERFALGMERYRAYRQFLGE